MVTISEAGDVGLVVEPPATLVTRQHAPGVYDMTTVAYAVDPEFVRRADSWREGSVKAVVIPPERAIDIDDELDLQIASCLWELRR
jgi:N-acylneuraminate cytidylyltransferase